MQWPTPINHFSHPRLDSGHARVIAMLKQKGAEKKQRHGEKTGGCLGAEHVGIILYIGKYDMYIRYRDSPCHIRYVYNLHYGPHM